MASAEYEAKRQANDTVGVWGVKLSIPAYGALPAKTIYWSTADAVELPDGTYTQRLASTPITRHQSDRGNDIAQIEVVNEDNVSYTEIKDHESLIERVKIEIFECFEIDKHYFEAEKKFHGYLSEFSLGESDRSLQFKAQSDTSRLGFLVGGRILTRERCGAPFNINGTLPATDSICGWQTIQGGNAVFCTKYRNGTDGCIAHNNDHRFYAVPALSSTVVQVIPTINPSGFPYDTGGCFEKNTLVLMANKSLKRICEITEDDLVMGYEEWTGKLKTTRVSKVHAFKGTLGIANFGELFGNLVVSDTHLFQTKNGYYEAIGSKSNGRLFSAYSSNLLEDKVIKNSYGSFYRDTVWTLSTSTFNFIVTNNLKKTFWKVHNRKAILPIDVPIDTPPQV